MNRLSFIQWRQPLEVPISLSSRNVQYTMIVLLHSNHCDRPVKTRSMIDSATHRTPFDSRCNRLPLHLPLHQGLCIFARLNTYGDEPPFSSSTRWSRCRAYIHPLRASWDHAGILFLFDILLMYFAVPKWCLRAVKRSSSALTTFSILLFFNARKTSFTCAILAANSQSSCHVKSGALSSVSILAMPTIKRVSYDNICHLWNVIIFYQRDERWNEKLQ